jgi:hypothetical protein
MLTVPLRGASFYPLRLDDPKAVYLTDTLVLRPDTVLIGLSPIATQLVLSDSTPAFQGVGGPKALLEAPQGGSNIVTGIGLDIGGINPRAVAARWLAGDRSLRNDVHASSAGMALILPTASTCRPTTTTTPPMPTPNAAGIPNIPACGAAAFH